MSVLPSNRNTSNNNPVQEVLVRVEHLEESGGSSSAVVEEHEERLAQHDVKIEQQERYRYLGKWEPVIDYKEHNIVSWNDKLWVCRADHYDWEPVIDGGLWDNVFWSIVVTGAEALEPRVDSVENTIDQLSQDIVKRGIRVWDYDTTYDKDDIVLHGTTPRDTWFYRSLTENNKGRSPSSGATYWVILAGNYEPTDLKGVDVTDIAAVTTAIKAGELDHNTSLSIGASTPVINIGTGANPKTINLGGAGDTVAVAGNLVTVHTDNLQVKDSLLRLNREGLSGSAADAGIEIEEAGAVTAYMKTNGTRNGFVLKAPAGSEFALNQSVATSSSPSFQSLTTSGYVNSTGLYSSKGIAINNWDDDMLSNNYCFIGRNRAGGTGRMSFGVHPGGGYGGFDWVTIGSSGTADNVPMTLSRDGALEVAGSIKAPSATINGNLTVTGTITGGSNIVNSTHVLTGSWFHSYNPTQANIVAKRYGQVVTIRFSAFEITMAGSDPLFVYDQSLPAECRISANFKVVVPFENGASIRHAHLNVVNGTMELQRPSADWDRSSNARMLEGTTITYIL
jgi:hypothetical protein